MKKRLIFTLLYKNGNYMLSRNFRLQKVGDLEWLKKYYDFENIAFSIDELIVLNVEDNNDRDLLNFANDLKKLSKLCFIPIAAGGGIKSIDDANLLFHSGADKIVLNSAFFNNINLIKELVKIFGKQNVVASIDFKNKDSIYIENGKVKIDIELKKHIMNVIKLGAGEIYINSIEKDGTGQGYELKVLDSILSDIDVSVICAGGAGKYEHFLEALKRNYIDAVATANLFNFLGNGLPNSRELLLNSNISIARWHRGREKRLKNILQKFV